MPLLAGSLTIIGSVGIPVLSALAIVQDEILHHGSLRVTTLRTGSPQKPEQQSMMTSEFETPLTRKGKLLIEMMNDGYI